MFSEIKLDGEAWRGCPSDSAPHHFLQLTTALRANLGDFSSMLLQLRWQQGRLDVVERSPYPRHRGEKVLWDSPSKDMDGGTGRDSFPNKPEKYTCLSLGSEHPNKIILICEPKRKKLTFPYWHPLSLLSPVPSPRMTASERVLHPTAAQKTMDIHLQGKKKLFTASSAAFLIIYCDAVDNTHVTCTHCSQRNRMWTYLRCKNNLMNKYI